MLTYKISARDINREVKVLDLAAKTVLISETGITIAAQAHGLATGDFVTFTRNDGDYIHYNEDVQVLEVLDKDTFIVAKFPEKLLPIYNAGVNELAYKPGSTKKYLTLLLTDGEHDFVEYRYDDRYKDYATYIREYIYGDYSQYVERMRRCDNDYILYEDTFLYRATVDAQTGKYAFPNTLSNTYCFIYVKPEGEDLLNYIKANPNGAGGWTVTEDGRVVLSGCVIPVNKNGQNDRTVILWEVRDTQLANLVAKNARISTFSAEDIRFIVRSDYEPQTGVFSLTNGTALQKVSYSASFSEPVFQDIGANLFQEEAIKTKYITNLIENLKNGVVDYEKKCFTPIYFDGDNVKDVEEIIFNLHFRKRGVERIQESGKTVGYTYGEWKTSDNYYWNNFIKDGEKLVLNNVNSVDDADLLGYLGFTDEDVIHERNRIGRSFLRLSFYDTPDRRNQKLLFTSTLFMNTGKYYEQYSSNIRSGIVPTGKPIGGEQDIASQYVYTENAQPRLCTSFSCKDKYATTSSSEGFYLYLFPGLLDENGKGTIYMKAEFNHAKYGYTIPFIMPVNSSDVPISPLVAGFPISYISSTTTEEGNVMEFVDVPKLFNDMYIKVNIEYDSQNNRYVWYLPKSGVWGSTMTLNLFEPRINMGTDFGVTISTNTIAASGGTISGTVHCGTGDTWTVEYDTSEISSISPDHGTGTANIVLSIPANMEVSESARQLSATFQCGAESYVIEISQMPVNYDFHVSPTQLEGLDWSADSVDITIYDINEYGWSIISKPNFVTVSEENGVGTKQVRVSVIKNEVEAQRSGTIEIKDNKYKQTHTILVTQECFEALWEFDEEEPDIVSWRGGEIWLILYDPEKLGYTIETTIPNWINLDVVEDEYGDYYHYFHFDIDENPLFEREVSIVVKDGTYGILKRTITIRQEENRRGNVNITVKPGQGVVQWQTVEDEHVSWTMDMYYENGGIPPSSSAAGIGWGGAYFDYGTAKTISAAPMYQESDLYIHIFLDIDFNFWDGSAPINRTFDSDIIYHIPLGNEDGTTKNVEFTLPRIIVDRNGNIDIENA